MNDKTLLAELERLDAAVEQGRDYSFDSIIWLRMLTALRAVDALGVAIANAGYSWTPEMRKAYEEATNLTVNSSWTT